MPENRTPYNIEFCRFIKCDEKKGNKCNVAECLFNHKWIVYWEAHGQYPPEGS